MVYYKWGELRDGRFNHNAVYTVRGNTWARDMNHDYYK